MPAQIQMILKTILSVPSRLRRLRRRQSKTTSSVNIIITCAQRQYICLSVCAIWSFRLMCLGLSMQMYTHQSQSWMNDNGIGSEPCHCVNCTSTFECVGELSKDNVKWRGEIMVNTYIENAIAYVRWKQHDMAWHSIAESKHFHCAHTKAKKSVENERTSMPIFSFFSSLFSVYIRRIRKWKRSRNKWGEKKMANA